MRRWVLRGCVTHREDRVVARHNEPRGLGGLSSLEVTLNALDL